MSLLKLHRFGSAVLRQRAKEVAAVDDGVRALIDDMFETMDAAKGIGLAANQVGLALRVAVIGAGDRRFALVNPRIVESAGRATQEEGCLSLPDLYAEVTRPERIVVEALDRDGQPLRVEADGIVARCIQHEIDHLDGILFVDHIGPLKRQMVLKRYRKEHAGEPVVTDVTPEESRTG
ncbi:MAG: peptide deformylase [Gemmatimonadales bacterium]|nr:peptide deformylase [Gemmatimonadales bacterium]